MKDNRTAPPPASQDHPRPNLEQEAEACWMALVDKGDEPRDALLRGRPGREHEGDVHLLHDDAALDAVAHRGRPGEDVLQDGLAA